MMPKNILIPLIIALAILNLILYINHQSIYKKYVDLKEKNERIQIENEELSQRLSETQGERRRLLERMDVIQKDLAEVSGEREEYKRKFEIALRRQKDSIESLKSVREENILLKQKLNQKDSERIELAERLKDAENEKETLNKRLAELEKRLEKKAEVTLPPIVVKPESLASPEISLSSVSGKIIAANKEYNFVIVDLGEEQGIEVGRSFEVFRDRNSIGKLEVIRTRSQVSACDIKEKSLDLEVGDVVR